MVGDEGTSAAVEELVKGTRQVAEFAEQFRAYSESEKHWKARMEFILRHLPDYQDQPDGGRSLDQLLALSMVWANHLFLGCSYNKELLDKVIEMADGIEVEDLPQFKTRDELMKKKYGMNGFIWEGDHTLKTLFTEKNTGLIFFALPNVKEAHSYTREQPKWLLQLLHPVQELSEAEYEFAKGSRDIITKEDFSSFHHAIECLNKRIDWKGF